MAPATELNTELAGFVRLLYDRYVYLLGETISASSSGLSRHCFTVLTRGEMWTSPGLGAPGRISVSKEHNGVEHFKLQG